MLSVVCQEGHKSLPPSPIHVGFVVNKVVFGQVFLENFGFSLSIIISSAAH